jgi:hypothetical protein
MEPAFIGSDSKVSSGTAPEDVGVMEDEGRVQSVFEQELGRLAEALTEPEKAEEIEMVLLAELMEDALDAGSCVLVGGVVSGADAGGTVLLVGGDAGELTRGATCELVVGRSA